MQSIVSVFALLLGAGEPIIGPKEFKRDTVGVFKVKTDGFLRVNVPDDLSIEKRDGEWFITGKPGVYKIRGDVTLVDWDAKKVSGQDVRVEFKITEGDSPAPPSPDNPPTPVPPGPNPPTPPVPPSPLVDPLAKDLQALYQAEGSASKREDMKKLAAVFRQAALYARSTQVKSVLQLITAIDAASTNLIEPTSLRGIRDRINGELEKSLPTTAETEMTEPVRTQCETAFNRMAIIAEALAR